MFMCKEMMRNGAGLVALKNAAATGSRILAAQNFSN
jgi:hypothetical protein